MRSAAFFPLPWFCCFPPHMRFARQSRYDLPAPVPRGPVGQLVMAATIDPSTAPVAAALAQNHGFTSRGAGAAGVVVVGATGVAAPTTSVGSSFPKKWFKMCWSSRLRIRSSSIAPPRAKKLRRHSWQQCARV